MENILKKIKIKRSELRASLGELNRDLRIVSGTSTRRLIEAEQDKLKKAKAREADFHKEWKKTDAQHKGFPVGHKYSNMSPKQFWSKTAAAKETVSALKKALKNVS